MPIGRAMIQTSMVEKRVTLKGETIAAEFQSLVDDYVQSHY